GKAPGQRRPRPRVVRAGRAGPQQRGGARAVGRHLRAGPRARLRLLAQAPQRPGRSMLRRARRRLGWDPAGTAMSACAKSHVIAVAATLALAATALPACSSGGGGYRVTAYFP